MSALGMSLIPSLGLSYQCPASIGGGGGGGLGRLSAAGSVSSSAIALLLSTSMSPSSVHGMIDNISVAPSTSWYFALTPFESIMIGILILKVN
jgi:hypothetical protein